MSLLALQHGVDLAILFLRTAESFLFAEIEHLFPSPSVQNRMKKFK